MAASSFAEPGLAGTMTQHLTQDLDLSQDKLVRVLDLAAQVKRTPQRFSQALAGRYLGLLFEKPSLRTRVTFELAIKQLGGKPVAKPSFVFPATSEKSFLALASVLENTGVGAYNGAAPSLQSKQVLASAGSIVQIEARHAAAIDLLIGKSPTPNEGFDKPLTKATVLGAVKPLIKP